VKLSHSFKALLLAAPMLAAAPAVAQNSDPAPLPAAPAPLPSPDDALPNDRNSLTIGLGGAYLPSYDGSDDYELSPFGLAFGRVAGFGFATRGTSLTVDLIPDDPNAPFAFDFGPVANIRLDRTRRIKDPQVRALGKIDTAIELGAYAGVTKNRVLHRYDSLGARITWQKDVSDTHGSAIVTPEIDYSTPLSTRTYALLSLQAEHVGKGYAQTYYSIDAAGAARSGLAVYNADSGWKDYRISLVMGQALTGDLRHPALSLFAGLSYSRLLGDFRRSPIVSVAGSPNQYLATLGLAYTF
jgi:outer membrane protein